MATTIFRVGKIKSMANVRQSGAHIHRHHKDTPNADITKRDDNKLLIGTNNLGADVQTRLNVLTKEPRANSVLAMDGMMTLSPEALQTAEEVERYTAHATKFLKDKFGKNLVNAMLHMDESSPHIHFTVVPVEEMECGVKKLNARDMFNKQELANMQKQYFTAMHTAFPKLTPPNHGAKAEHKKLKDYYAKLDKAKNELVEQANKLISDMQNLVVAKVERHITPVVEMQVNAISKGLMEQKGIELSNSYMVRLKQKQMEAVKKAANEVVEQLPAMQQMQQQMCEVIEGFDPAAGNVTPPPQLASAFVEAEELKRVQEQMWKEDEQQQQQAQQQQALQAQRPSAPKIK